MNVLAASAPRVRERTGVALDAIPYAELLAAQAPTILRGIARDWPLVAAARKSDEAAIAYVERFDSGQPVVGFTGAPEIGGRFHYNAGLTGFNFEGARVGMADFLERIRAQLDAPSPASFYIGSTDLDRYLPGFRAENDLPLDDPMFAHGVLASIWIGTRTTAHAHHDMSHNMAICAAGKRRFTLFPPEQIANLYPGPLEPTPGGQVISMVDFADPDFAAHPRFRDAMASAQVAELEPGDLLFYPALWWHHVEALGRFNILVNYWWNEAPAFLDTPQTTLLHALLSLRDRPDAEKAAWKAMFDYYVFGPAGQAAAHLPAHAQGPLAPIDATSARRLRAQLINKLNR
ncbi:cupin-like domain-containing protein [Sphingomonas sp. NIBR02145]|uniref:cupin-like domain-containing protein n=1 Tax=Sphingomonas sp. NIBR02145 TaxID=3014784 RepID=UPI0022B390E1|nr:cupin-like domain-containing protein [Sphingomonas sp. NIBR02145]WHU02530.1 cupin-like domain-containing protein [Sphingomonas sp. NIBR02145]